MFFQGEDSRDLVKKVQTALQELGKDLGPSGIDGVFGNATEKAVKSFQEENKDFEGNALGIDGLVGPETSDALNRKMVGKHFDIYQTPKEITDGKLIVTATLKAAKEGFDLDVSGMESIKFFLVDFNLFNIALFDADGERFSQFEEAKFEVLDEEDKVLAEGSTKPQEDITVATTSRPTKARLIIGSVVYEFPLDQAS